MFEPNDEPLWAQSASTSARSCRACSARAPSRVYAGQAYFVKCDTDNHAGDIDLGVVNILVGFAPLYPAEFVVIQIQQIAASPVLRSGGMAEFTVNPTRFDPYKNFKFRVKWDGNMSPVSARCGC